MCGCVRACEGVSVLVYGCGFGCGDIVGVWVFMPFFIIHFILVHLLFLSPIFPLALSSAFPPLNSIPLSPILCESVWVGRCGRVRVWLFMFQWVWGDCGCVGACLCFSGGEEVVGEDVSGCMYVWRERFVVVCVMLG